MAQNSSNSWGRIDETVHAERRLVFPLGVAGCGYRIAPDVEWSSAWYRMISAAWIAVVLVAWGIGSWYDVGWSALVICAGLLAWCAVICVVDRRLRHVHGGEPIAWIAACRLQVRALSPMFLGMQILMQGLLFWLFLLENEPMLLGLSQKLFAILVFLPQLALNISLLMLKLVDGHRASD